MKSIWQKGLEFPSFPKLQEDMKTDVLIIGGGIAGILTGYFLKKNGVECVIAEKRSICQGTTGHTTAKLTFQHDLIYQNLLKSSGAETAQKYPQANKAAFEEYARICKNIDCDYEISDNYVYFINDRRKLEEELSALDRIGYRAEFSSEF